MAPPSNRHVFGQAMHKKNDRSGGGGAPTNSKYGNNNNNNRSNYQRQLGTSSRPRGSSTATSSAASLQAQRRAARLETTRQAELSFGLDRVILPENIASLERRGWLYNLVPTAVTVSDDTSVKGPERSGLELYFASEDNRRPPFVATVLFRPYFYVLPHPDAFNSTTTDSHQSSILLELIRTHLRNTYEPAGLYACDIVHRQDLDQPNHLSPSQRHGRVMLKLVFDTTAQLIEVRKALQEIVAANVMRRGGGGAGATRNWSDFSGAATPHANQTENPMSYVTDLREYDVPYVVRVCTDLDIRAGTWYTVQWEHELMSSDTAALEPAAGSTTAQGPLSCWVDTGGVRLTNPDRERKAEPVVLAFDIECTKAPLKFPRADVDEIFMISYMVSNPATGKAQGYLITSRSVVSADVSDFDYTPKASYPGPFRIFNEVDEKALLTRFFAEFRRLCPQIVVTYNGDFFDFPFVDARAQHHGLNLFREIGLSEQSTPGPGTDSGGYRGRWTVHLDAFHWVQRDSYLPQGAQGLKAVTKYKLGYDPVEVDPEDMLRFAHEKPVHMATYSVSDAVATYYLYDKYVHLFIFSLSTMIPMGPEDVLSKGSGTLCEALLMVQACKKNIICPNKQVDAVSQFHKGHLLEAETYIGGKVECLESGVFRSDLLYDFDLKPKGFQQLIDNLDRDLIFAIEVEHGQKRDSMSNYKEVRDEMARQLESLRDRPKRTETPSIYHLDVGAMYPNIILTNRLQPSAIVNDSTCAACDFHQAKNGCKRHMEWIWRGDYSPATRAEYERTKDQLRRETQRDGLQFDQLPGNEQATLAADRLKTYTRKAYKKTKVTEEESRKDVVCMRENDFYVDTVRQFRDRRYEYKKMNKDWKKKAAGATDAAAKKECEDRVLVYDSLQVAHKCILNSFYGYVMRKGARWRSMEMAGIVTKTGADIIVQARELVEQIGRPLELDTDGIWCILPSSFPEVFTFKAIDGSPIKIEYPCLMLNANVHDKFTNHQFQTLVDPERGVYEARSECSIFFEVDGPYRCMVIPASTEEGKLLKKRYAVFNFDGSLAELKGFELKRRGELELIKTFQSQVFERFLGGNSLQECYGSVADVANHWIDVIDTRGESLDDDELVDLISENRSMSRQLDDYGKQKGTSQTTARRLGEFLGADIVKDKGLNCKFIIAEQPYGSPVTDRAIPTVIWKAEPAVMKHYLRKWLKSPGLDGDGLDIRNILDWDYYLDRLGKTIQKIITIPAALQNVPNPVPRVAHPSWLETKISASNDRFQQQSIRDMFGVMRLDTSKSSSRTIVDIEDMNSAVQVSKRPIVHKMRRVFDSESQQGNVHERSDEAVEQRVELSKENFDDWLKQKKKSWLDMRNGRRVITNSIDRDGVVKKQRNAVSMEGFVREGALSLSEKEWQILEVREMSTYDALTPGTQSGSGDFIVWVMVGSSTLQKVIVSVPRTVYITTRKEITNTSDDILEFRRVDKHLPYSKSVSLVYEVTMPEHVFKAQKWANYLKPVDPLDKPEDILESLYESGTPLLSKILTQVGSMARLNPSAARTKKKKSYTLLDLVRVDRPLEGEYLHRLMIYKRVFLFVRINSKSKSGVVALFNFAGDRGSADDSSESVDATRPTEGPPSSFNVGASCFIWVVKPMSRNSQRSVSLKQCETMFSQLLDTVQAAADANSDYACVSPLSAVNVASLKFVESEQLAFSGANEAISAHAKTGHGATLIIMNSTRSASHLRRCMSVFSSLPVLSMPFPPGPAHDPSSNTLPSLNWEQPAVHLSFEAYLFMVVVSFPKRVSYCRYGQVPIGNFDQDECKVVYDVSLSRLIHKNRALSWASLTPGRPDVGVTVMPSTDGAIFPVHDVSSAQFSPDEIWGDDEELVSPVIRRPGCYRSICVDIDIQDLAIAALTNAVAAMSTIGSGHSGFGKADPISPNNVALFDGNFSFSNVAGPLGDEMSASISLPIVRALVSGWLKDAFTMNSLVADELLHHIYRLISDPDTLLHDPSLHRAVHSLMKATFLRLLGELQRLGCSVVYASFHKVTVATNKIELADAEEYINFVIETARRDSSDLGDDSLSKVSLRPRLFHSNLVFLDEFNFGTMQLDRFQSDEIDESVDFSFPYNEDPNTIVAPTVVTAWSIMNYLRSERAQMYFRVTMGRFSKEVMKKQMELVSQEGVLPLVGALGMTDQLLAYKRKLISKHFAASLTRAVSEILKEGSDDDVAPPLLLNYDDHKSSSSSPGSHGNSALEFVKNVVAMLELDTDIDTEVQALKRSLLTQLGVAEYAQAAQWTNPCSSFILPDVFCTECQDTRDVNLCYIPPRPLVTSENEREEEQEIHHWSCDECGTAYNIHGIEGRLLQMVQKKLARYVLQDVRCTKTSMIASRALAALSTSSQTLKLDISTENAQRELRLLLRLAELYGLEILQETVGGLLSSYQQ